MPNIKYDITAVDHLINPMEIPPTAHGVRKLSDKLQEKFDSKLV